ncbi:phoE Broad specificity phosphatase PhoE and related phosphatases [Fimbriimonadaceae bacterium]
MMLALLASVALAPAEQTSLLIVRHGETLANASGRYNSKTINTFSEKGNAQVARLTKELGNRRFNAIIVSPSERALRTVAPFLKATGQKATVWPELYECCTGRNKRMDSNGKIRMGAAFAIPKDIAPLFRIEPGHEKLIVSQTFSDGVMQVRQGARRLATEFGPNYGSVLIVGHSGAGGVLMEILEGKTTYGKKHPENAVPYAYELVNSSKFQFRRKS